MENFTIQEIKNDLPIVINSIGGIIHSKFFKGLPSEIGKHYKDKIDGLIVIYNKHLTSREMMLSIDNSGNLERDVELFFIREFLLFYQALMKSMKEYYGNDIDKWNVTESKKEQA